MNLRIALAGLALASASLLGGQRGATAQAVPTLRYSLAPLIYSDDGAELEIVNGSGAVIVAGAMALDGNDIAIDGVTLAPRIGVGNAYLTGADTGTYQVRIAAANVPIAMVTVPVMTGVLTVVTYDID